MLPKPVVEEILSLVIAKSFRFRLQYGHELCPTIQASRHCGAGENRRASDFDVTTHVAHGGGIKKERECVCVRECVCYIWSLPATYISFDGGFGMICSMECSEDSNRWSATSQS